MVLPRHSDVHYSEEYFKCMALLLRGTHSEHTVLFFFVCVFGSTGWWWWWSCCWWWWGNVGTEAHKPLLLPRPEWVSYLYGFPCCLAFSLTLTIDVFCFSHWRLLLLLLFPKCPLVFYNCCLLLLSTTCSVSLIDVLQILLFFSSQTSSIPLDDRCFSISFSGPLPQFHWCLLISLVLPATKVCFLVYLFSHTRCTEHKSKADLVKRKQTHVHAELDVTTAD